MTGDLELWDKISTNTPLKDANLHITNMPSPIRLVSTTQEIYISQHEFRNTIIAIVLSVWRNYRGVATDFPRPRKIVGHI
jgi:hypothetical protein